MTDEADFDAFVVARSQALLRTAYLLVQDEGRAEDLVQTALTKAWFAWKGIRTSPEAYVRRIMVTTSASWWRRRWTRETPTAVLPERASAGIASGPADATGPLGRDRTPAAPATSGRRSPLPGGPHRVETAQLLGCSVGTVKSQCSKALIKLRLDPALEPAPDERSRA